jgi:hypothetical protein
MTRSTHLAGAIVCAITASLSACSRSNPPANAATPPLATTAPVQTPAAVPAVPTGAAPAGATALDTHGAPNFGQRDLAPGFLPDPVTVNVTAGGSLSASDMNLGTGCRGYVSARPDYSIHLSAADSFLRIYVTSEQDTTLVVSDSAGHWFCNDDSSFGLNPMVDLTNASPGVINVWVGSYHEGATAPGVLHVTEMQSNHP